jgi:microcompartment protein CcmK/EutM
MILAQVVGTVVASRKEPSIDGFKLMAVVPVGPDLKPSGGLLVAVDAVGAGVGETVLVVSGSSARYTEVTTGKPADLSILAIVDLIETAEGRLYSKAGAS